MKGGRRVYFVNRSVDRSGPRYRHGSVVLPLRARVLHHGGRRSPQRALAGHLIPPRLRPESDGFPAGQSHGTHEGRDPAADRRRQHHARRQGV